MAAITGGSFTFTPCPARTTTSSAVLSASLFLRSRSCRIRVSVLTSPRNRPAVISRDGGGGGGGGGGGPGRPRAPSDSRRSRKNDSDDDDGAMDLSFIRCVLHRRMIDDQQKMVGVVSKSEAIQMAEDAELDLVILSPDADPPVVRIMDYNKFRYKQQKRKREQQKKSSASRMDLKELKMGYNIDQHDYSVRLKAAQKFLKDGDKVKVIVNLKGRENDFRKIAIELIRRFQSDVGELATEAGKNLSDRNMFIILVPNKAVLLLQKSLDPPKKRDKSSAKEVSAKT